jgi:hypothetical protein
MASGNVPNPAGLPLVEEQPRGTADPGQIPAGMENCAARQTTWSPLAIPYRRMS